MWHVLPSKPFSFAPPNLDVTGIDPFEKEPRPKKKGQGYVEPTGWTLM